MSEQQATAGAGHTSALSIWVAAANYVPTFACLLAVAANHSLFRLGSLPWGWTIALAAVIAVTSALAPHLARPGKIEARPSLSNWAIGIVLVAPVVLSFVLGFGREFPFSGDQSFHIKQAYYLGFWWLSPPGSEPLPILGRALNEGPAQDLIAHPWHVLMSRAVLLAVIIAAVVVCYRRHRLLAAGIAGAALVAWGAFEHAIYLRYPGGGYALTFPFLGVGPVLKSFELPGRIANVLAAPAWLFVLRPLLVGRWPDWNILPVAALLLWQRDTIYYFDSTYLEPWAAVFALLAVEIVIVRGAAGAPATCLLIGLAATVKEPAIFALPFVWLAGQPWRVGRRDLATLCGSALAAGFPFVLYYVSRNSLSAADVSVGRVVSFGFSPSDLMTYASGLGRQFAHIFGGANAVAALLAPAAIIFVATRARFRMSLLCLTAAALAIMTVFLLDHGSRYWAGNFRFLLAAWPFFLAGLVALGYAFGERVALVTGLAIALLQAPGAYVGVARSAGPASDRNFAEHYDAPLVFPLKSIVAEAGRRYGLPKNAPVWSNEPDPTVKPLPGLSIDFARPSVLPCGCTNEHANVLALFVRYANLNARFADTPPSPDDPFVPRHAADHLWRQDKADRAVCLQQMRQSCAHVIVREEAGEIVAVLGLR